ncbi:alpha/beta hydrolase family protein [Marinobacter nauticus]
MRSERGVSLLLWCLLAIFSSTALAQEGDEGQPAEPERPAGTPANERFSVTTGLGEWALASQYPEQAVWLELEAGSRALALFRPEQQVPARSAMIVLANEGQTADEAIVGALRRTLPDDGIAVMTLGLRAPPDVLRESRQSRKVPAPGDGEDGGPEGDDPSGGNAGSVMIDVAAPEDLEALAENYQNNVSGLLDAAAGALRDRGYERLLVLGVGWSADYVTEWAAGQGRLAGVIWLAPAFTPDRVTALTEVLAEERDWRLLDLHGTSNQAIARERAAELARAEVGQYRRLPLPMASAPDAADADGIANWVSAWVGQ